LNRNFTN